MDPSTLQALLREAATTPAGWRPPSARWNGPSPGIGKGGTTPASSAIAGTPSTSPTPAARWTWGRWRWPCTPPGLGAEVMSLLLGHRYTHETKGAITDEVLERAEAFRGRPLPEEKVLREGLGVERVALPEGRTS